MYRNGRKSTIMVAGEAKSKRTNSFPLRQVLGVYVTTRLKEIVCFPVLKCGHIDLDNAREIKSALFWRDGWKQTKFRCRSCGDDLGGGNLFFTRCECDYRAVLIRETDLLDALREEINRLRESGLSFGFNLFPADCRTLNLDGERQVDLG